KEVLVMAGELVRERMRRHGSQIFPIDSEHSAIWQCLWGEKEVGVRRLILTGSGGPFLRRPVETPESGTGAEAPPHPRRKMGAKRRGRGPGRGGGEGPPVPPYSTPPTRKPWRSSSRGSAASSTSFPRSLARSRRRNRRKN